jgi:hypothetical protein
MSFVILMRRRHLDNTTLFVFPKCVILKREKSVVLSWRETSKIGITIFVNLRLSLVSN